MLQINKFGIGGGGECAKLQGFCESVTRLLARMVASNICGLSLLLVLSLL